jgi:hypothetical protein
VTAAVTAKISILAAIVAHRDVDRSVCQALEIFTNIQMTGPKRAAPRNSQNSSG